MLLLYNSLSYLSFKEEETGNSFLVGGGAKSSMSPLPCQWRCQNFRFQPLSLLVEMSKFPLCIIVNLSFFLSFFYLFLFSLSSSLYFSLFLSLAYSPRFLPSPSLSLFPSPVSLSLPICLPLLSPSPYSHQSGIVHPRYNYYKTVPCSCSEEYVC